MVNLLHLLDDAKCFATVRQMRWPAGVTCPHCDGPQIAKQGFDETQPARQRYLCHGCDKKFDDLTGTIFQNAAAFTRRRSPVAQLVERRTVNPLVGGSSPSRGANSSSVSDNLCNLWR